MLVEDWKNDIALKMVMEKIGIDYELLDYIGGGGLARIYTIRHTIFNEVQALKIMDFNYIFQVFEKEGIENIDDEFEKIKKRFINEAKFYKKLSHPNIIKIHKIGFVKYEPKNIDIPYLVVEYVKGRSLKKILKERPRLEMQRVLKISENVLSALDAIHRNGVVHRDIKPSNIMIKEDSGEVVLIDFGLAKDLENGDDLTVSRTAMGTLNYMSPEMFRDSKEISPAVDIYSFGVILYEMIAGEVPFTGSFPQIMHGHLSIVKSLPDAFIRKNPALAGEVGKILKKAMAKSVGDRYETAGDFITDLKKLEIDFLEIDNNDKLKKRKVKWIVSFFGIIVFAAFFYSIDPFDLFNGGGNGGNPEIQYREHIYAVNKFMETGDIPKAIASLKKAKEIKDTDEVIRLKKLIELKKIELDKMSRKGTYDEIKENVSLEKYLGFKTLYPDSVYLPDLKNRLVKKDEKLPPEKYWDKGIVKNKKGYYELSFGPENNGHLMIYIPEKNFWIDKYEVSWAQFRKYLKDAIQPIPPGDRNGYINDAGEFPAVVTFDEAAKYAEKYGLRLPTESEWEYAAGYGFRLPNKDEWEHAPSKGNLTYPWGNESPDMPDVNGYWRANFNTSDGDRDKDGYIGTAPVRSFEEFSSPFGVVNMAGNVWEWEQGRVLKGGGFLSTSFDLKIESTRNAEPDDKGGFRCVKVEET